MGGYAGCIGDFALHMGDYVFDYVRNSAPKEYFENKTIEMDFIHYLPGFKKHPFIIERNQDRYGIEVPLLNLGTIEKLKKHYRFTPDFNLTKLLWEEIEKRSFTVEGYASIGNYYEEDGKTIWKYYYLTSGIGEHPIKLQEPTEDVDILHEVHNYDEHMWLIKNGFDFYTEIRK